MNVDILDGIAAVGLLLVTVGAWGIWGWAVACLLCGGLLLAFVVAGAVNSTSTGEEDDEQA